MVASYNTFIEVVCHSVVPALYVRDPEMGTAAAIEHQLAYTAGFMGDACIGLGYVVNSIDRSGNPLPTPRQLMAFYLKFTSIK